MATPIATILNQAAILLNDTAETRWTATEKLTWLNEGLRELIVLRPDAKVKRAAALLVQGAKQALPDESVALIEVRTENGPVLPCDRRALDLFASNWQQKPTASTVKNFMYSAAEHPTYWVYPAQNATPATVELVYSAYPATATIGGTLDVQDKYASKLVDYLMYRALSKDAEVGSAERAAAYYQLFKA